VKRVQQQTKPSVKPAAAPVKKTHLAQPNGETMDLDTILVNIDELEQKAANP